MELYEISALLKFSYYKDKESWEQTRFLGFINARIGGAKISKVEDLIKFQWEVEKDNEKKRAMTDEEMQNFRNKAAWIIENNILNE